LIVQNNTLRAFHILLVTAMKIFDFSVIYLMPQDAE